MTLIREKIRLSSLVALFVFAIGLALSFGHVQFDRPHEGGAGFVVHEHGANHQDNDEPGSSDHCNICAFIAQFRATVLAVPLALALPLYDTVHSHAKRFCATPGRRAYALFQSRAPPES
jgi:hypothetical protein